MRALGLTHAHAGFQAGAPFTGIAVAASSMASSPLRRPLPPPRIGAWSAVVATTRRHGRHHNYYGRPYSVLFAAANDASAEREDLPDANAPEGEDTPAPYDADAGAIAGAAAADNDGAGGEGGGSVPVPRAGEQIEESIVGADEEPAMGAEESVDWDKAWASTRQKMEEKEKEVIEKKKETPAFSGRKQVVATKNSEGGYDFVEISADGSRQGGGGFGFADDGQAGKDGRGKIRNQEQEAVNLATTNQAFGVLFAVLVASLVFEVYIYLSGGITNGSTRFQGMGQPTVYDALPLPATPSPDDDLSV